LDWSQAVHDETPVHTRVAGVIGKIVFALVYLGLGVCLVRAVVAMTGP
jgi:hypothetical protein